MNEKRWWIGILGGGTLGALGVGALIYLQHGKVQQARDEVGVLRTQIDSARKTIEGTGALEREVIALREVSEVIKRILPDEQDINNLVRTFQSFSGESGVRITGLKKKNNVATGSGGFDKVTYTLSLASDAFQLLDFMDRAESHHRFMRIPSFKINAAQRNQMDKDGVPAHKVQIDLETFVYDSKKDSQPVRIEGYERKRDLLMGEINRRREALTVSTYAYRGPRGRRDPWIDPRVPIEGDGESALTVQEQMELVQEFYERTQAVIEKWGEVQQAENVIVEMMARAELEENLAQLEEDVRRTEKEGSISYVPSQRRLQIEVVDIVVDLRSQISSSEVGRGPSEDTLREVMETMMSHLEHSEFDLMLEAFAIVDDRLALAETDPRRVTYVERLRELAQVAGTVTEFDDFDLDIRGTAIMEGEPPVVLINGKSLGVGDLVHNELIVNAITAEEVEFLFRGLILARRF